MTETIRINLCDTCFECRDGECTWVDRPCFIDTRYQSCGNYRKRVDCMKCKYKKEKKNKVICKKKHRKPFLKTDGENVCSEFKGI